ncbi:MAG TPA: S8 family serine peptidase, partial [Anaerolineae bacterium]|nr:S8 family serine peptidase [Anaerolineae bacterium]
MNNHLRFAKYLFLVVVTPLLVMASLRIFKPIAASAGVDRVSIDAGAPLIKQSDVLGEVPTNQIIIKYEASADLSGINAPAHANRMQALSAAAGVHLEYFREMSGDAHVLRLPERMPVAQVEQIARRIAAMTGVEYVEPDRILQPLLTPNDPQYGSQWHYFETYGINAPAAWDITTGTNNVVVAVIDTGATNHADLSGRAVPGYDFISDVPTANDGNGRDSDPSDPGDWVTSDESNTPGGPFQGCLVVDSGWHGTHVAGTIGANGNNSTGVAGVNWASRILPVRVLGKCGGYTSDIVDGMRWAAGLSVAGVPANAYPAEVLNLSLGGPGTCTSSQQSAISAIVAAGSTVVVAAGNENADASGSNPGNCSGVITVAATDRSGNRAFYSNYGSVVEISAPGGETNVSDLNGILSTLNTGTTVPAFDTYVFYQGTSMAAPHVAGVASLLYSLSPSLTPGQVGRILTTTITAFPVGSSCNTSICGAGIVNAGASVNTLPRIAGTSPVTATTGGPTFTMIITGANFASGATAKWNGSSRATQVLSSTQLSVTISAADIAVSGNYSLTVTSVHATYGAITTAARTFLVQGPASERVYLPLIMRNWPPIPPAPVLNAINNADGDGAYNVTWSASSTATSYTLEEDDNSSFSSPTAVYSGSGLLWVASGKAGGTYYYRVKA